MIKSDLSDWIVVASTITCTKCGASETFHNYDDMAESHFLSVGWRVVEKQDIDECLCPKCLSDET